MIIKSVALAACAAAALGLSATAATSQSVARPRTTSTVVVAVDLPLQGSNATVSTDTQRMVQLFLTRAGGTAGKYAVVLRQYDDSTAAAGSWDDATCASNGRQHANRTGEIAVLGTYNSGCSELEVPYLNQASPGPLLMVSHANTNPVLTKYWGTPGLPAKFYPTGVRNYARVQATDDWQGVAGARFVQNRLHRRRVFVLNDGSTYGSRIAQVFVNQAHKLGMVVVGKRTWSPRAANYTALFRAIKQTHPGAIYLGGTYDHNGQRLLNDKVAVLGTNSTVPVVTPDGFTGYPDLDRAATGQGIYSTYSGLTLAALLVNNPTGQALVRAFRHKYGYTPATSYPLYGVAAMQVIRTAIARSNGTRASVTRAVLGPNAVTIAKANSVLGRAFTISRTSGDTNAIDITVQTIKNRRETTVQSMRF